MRIEPAPGITNLRTMEASYERQTSVVCARDALTNPLFQRFGVLTTGSSHSHRLYAAVKTAAYREVAPAGPRKRYLIDRVWRGYNVLNGVRMLLGICLFMAWIFT